MKITRISTKKNYSQKCGKRVKKNSKVEREAKNCNKLNESREESRLLIKTYGEGRQEGNGSRNPDVNGIDLLGAKKLLGPQPSNFRRDGNDD